jgi:transposase
MQKTKIAKRRLARNVGDLANLFSVHRRIPATLGECSPTGRYTRDHPVEVAVRTGCGTNDPMHHTARDLSDDQWRVLDPLIPEPKRRNDGRGRPWKSRRSVLNGMPWVLRTGAPWADLPKAYPSFQTCHRRFQQWVRSGVMKGILEALALDLTLRGAIDVREAFIDASFVPAKKGA